MAISNRNENIGKLIISYCSLLILIVFSSVVFGSAPIDRQINELMELAKAGNDSEFIHKLDNQQLVNKSDSNGHSPLFVALFGSPTLVAKVLQRGGDIHHADSNGMTPLISASMLGFHEAVKQLLEKGSEVNRKMKDGNPALKVAIVSASANALPTNNKYHHQFAATVQELVKHGADVNVLDKYGAPILLYPVFNKNYAICEILLKAGANANFIYKGSSLLAIAKQFSNDEIVQLLIKYGAR